MNISIFIKDISTKFYQKLRTKIWKKRQNLIIQLSYVNDEIANLQILEHIQVNFNLKEIENTNPEEENNNESIEDIDTEQKELSEEEIEQENDENVLSSNQDDEIVQEVNFK